MTRPPALNRSDLPAHPVYGCACSAGRDSSLDAAREVWDHYRWVWLVIWNHDDQVSEVEHVRVLRVADGSVCIDDDKTEPRHIPGEELDENEDVWVDSFYDDAYGPVLLRLWADAEEARDK